MGKGMPKPPPRVQNFVTLIAMEMRNSFEKQDSIHRDATWSKTLSGYIPSLQNTVPFDSKRVAVCLRRKRVEVTNFSTWGGGEAMSKPEFEKAIR
jgi:hypothetical protein